jgi:hypothetical protein
MSKTFTSSESVAAGRKAGRRIDFASRRRLLL